MLSLIENVENFKDLEKKVYGYFCNASVDKVNATPEVRDNCI